MEISRDFATRFAPTRLRAKKHQLIPRKATSTIRHDSHTVCDHDRTE